MAQVSYDHIEAPVVIRDGSAVAFNIGDPVPLPTAHRLGLLTAEDAPEIIRGTKSIETNRFVDGELTVTPDATSTAPDATTPTPPTGSATTPAPSTQTKADALKQGQPTTTTP